MELNHPSCYTLKGPHVIFQTWGSGRQTPTQNSPPPLPQWSDPCGRGPASSPAFLACELNKHWSRFLPSKYQCIRFPRHQAPRYQPDLFCRKKEASLAVPLRVSFQVVDALSSSPGSQIITKAKGRTEGKLRETKPIFCSIVFFATKVCHEILGRENRKPHRARLNCSTSAAASLRDNSWRTSCVRVCVRVVGALKVALKALKREILSPTHAMKREGFTEDEATYLATNFLKFLKTS